MLGILATVCYYALVQLGNGLIHAETLSISAGVWLPNLVGGVAALALVFRLTHSSSFSLTVDRPPRKERKLVALKDAPVVIRPKRWALQRYIASLFVRMLGLLFVAFLVAYFLVDILERLAWFARYEPGLGEFAQFYGWRLPLLASRVIRVGSILTVP